MVDTSIPAPEKTGVHFSDSVILYGIKLNAGKPCAEFDAGDKGDSSLQMHLSKSGKTLNEDQYAIVLGYGYAFEGHCYRLDKTRIFVVKGLAGEPAQGCGFDTEGASDTGYAMWRIRAEDELLEIGLAYGDVRKLILDANLPGKRAPSSYAITASLAHRDGRLQRE